MSQAMSSTSTNTTNKATPSAFIDDGFTIEGQIVGRNGLIPDFTVSYRPFDWMERDASRRRVGEHKEGTPDYYRVRSEELASRLVSWSLGKGVTPENVRKLKPMIFDILESLVFGIIGPDVLLSEKEKGLITQARADIKN